MSVDVQSLADIRISDPVTKRLVEDERLATGDSTATKTARRMIHECHLLRKVERERRRNGDGPSLDPSIPESHDPSAPCETPVPQPGAAP